MLQIANAETGETEKMSKSLNNFLLLHEVLEQVRPRPCACSCCRATTAARSCSASSALPRPTRALTRIENAVKALDWLLETGTPPRRGGP